MVPPLTLEICRSVLTTSVAGVNNGNSSDTPRGLSLTRLGPPAKPVGVCNWLMRPAAKPYYRAAKLPIIGFLGSATPCFEGQRIATGSDAHGRVMRKAGC